MMPDVRLSVFRNDRLEFDKERPDFRFFDENSFFAELPDSFQIQQLACSGRRARNEKSNRVHELDSLTSQVH